MRAVERRRKFSRQVIVLFIVGALLIAGLLVVWLLFPNIWWFLPAGAPNKATGIGGVRSLSTVSSDNFSITGDASVPISPGVSAPLNLEFTNPREVPLSFDGLTVTLREIRAPHANASRPCSLKDFSVEQLPRDVVITLPPNSATTLSGLGVLSTKLPRVGMINRTVNQDGCKGAALTLAYTASGTDR